MMYKSITLVVLNVHILTTLRPDDEITTPVVTVDLHQRRGHTMAPDPLRSKIVKTFRLHGLSLRSEGSTYLQVNYIIFISLHSKVR